MLGELNGPNVAMDYQAYFRTWSKAENGKDFVLKLMSLLLREETMARSNFYGGHVFNGKAWVHKYQLRVLPEFCAIIKQAESEFPGCFHTEKEQKTLRDAVNGKCRRAAQVFFKHHY